MNTVKPVTGYNLIQPAVHKAGVALPTELTERMAHIAAVAGAGLGTMRNAATDELVTATAKALDEGRDPLTDKAVNAALVRQQFAAATNWETALESWQQEQAGAALSKHADRLLRDWAAIIGRAGTDLAAALTHLDRTSSLEAQAGVALRAGGERGEAWRTAAHALEVVDNLCNAWQYLAVMALGLAGYNADRGGALLRNPNLTLAQLNKVPNRVGTWELVAEHGVAVTGASLEDYRAAVARVGQEIQAASEITASDRARAAQAKSMTAVRLR